MLFCLFLLLLLLNGGKGSPVFEMVSDEIDDTVEQLIQSFPLFGRNLKMFWSIFGSLRLAVLLGHLPLGQVDLIPHENFDSIWCLVQLEHLVPNLQVLKWAFLGDVIDHHCAIGIFHVVWNETAESFLSRGVPQLYAELSSVSSDVFDVEIDADSRLHRVALTFKPSSKRSFMYFSMIDDFPTDWSPKKMILYFVLPPPTVDDDTLIKL